MDLDPPRASCWPAISESDLLSGYGLPRYAATLERRRETARARDSAQDVAVIAERPTRRRPTALRPGDRGGRLSAVAGGPIRLVVHLLRWGDELPLLEHYRTEGWHVHRIGAAAYVHLQARPDFPGTLFGFRVDPVTPERWLRWLARARTDATRPRPLVRLVR